MTHKIIQRAGLLAAGGLRAGRPTGWSAPDGSSPDCKLWSTVGA